MSRAFVKEHDEAETFQDLADRPISPFRNLVTASGLRQIETQIAEFRTAYGKAIAALDKAATAEASRDLCYWVARRASAELIEPPKNSHVVRFGTRVTIYVKMDNARHLGSSAKMRPIQNKGFFLTYLRLHGRFWAKAMAR